MNYRATVDAEAERLRAVVEESQVAQRAGRPLWRADDRLRRRAVLRPGPLRPVQMASGADRGCGRAMPDQETDGRRRRTLDSRARIVAAMMELTRAGEISVSAEKVADEAKVGLRTVFRHFKDMDSLYREMSLSIEARIRQELARPLRSDDWRGTRGTDRPPDDDLRDHHPVQTGRGRHRHRSRFLEWDIQRLNTGLREILRAVLPVEIAGNEPLFEALDLLLSFESWDRLRREQGLSGPPGPRRCSEVAAAKLTSTKSIG